MPRFITMKRPKTVGVPETEGEAPMAGDGMEPDLQAAQEQGDGAQGLMSIDARTDPESQF